MISVYTETKNKLGNFILLSVILLHVVAPRAHNDLNCAYILFVSNVATLGQNFFCVVIEAILLSANICLSHKGVGKRNLTLKWST
jgi:hypothetical protein